MNRYISIAKHTVAQGVLVAGLSSAVLANPYYVSPNGNDGNAGTINAPFKTVARARDVVRTVNSTMTGDITVNLRSGWYTQDVTLAFDQRDNGNNGFNVIYQAYPGETPVISGGRQLTGWTLHDAAKDIWKASAPGLETRQLYVDCVKATRAHSGAYLPGAYKTTWGYTTTDTNMQYWGNKTDVELVHNSMDTVVLNKGRFPLDYYEWRLGVADITGSAITMKTSYSWGGWNTDVVVCVTVPSDVENAYELLDEPGEWYLNRAQDVVYYKPLPGRSMSAATVIAPVLETLMTGTGALATPIKNLQFKGITFAHCTWLHPNTAEGYVNYQANYLFNYGGNFVGGGVEFKAAQQIVFERCMFKHLGREGLVLWGGAQNCTVRGCVFTETSGSGLRIGNEDDPARNNPQARDISNQVVNCYINNTGCDYHDGTGFTAVYVADLLLSHNDIENTAYSGVSCGWGWDGAGSFARNNELSYNRIHNYMTSLGDGAGLYTLNSQPNSSWHHNFMYSEPGDANGGAFYPDQGSAWMKVYSNVIWDVGLWMIIWGPLTHDMTIYDNWTTTLTKRDAGTACTINGTTLLPRPFDQWPLAAQTIANSAGLEPAYQDIKTMYCACSILADTGAIRTPSFSPPAGTYTTMKSVTITSPSKDVSIRYTLNGDTPDAIHGIPYTGPVKLSATATLKAMAFKAGRSDSAEASGLYTLQLPTPTDDFVNGGFENGTNGWRITSSSDEAAAYAINGGAGFTDGANALVLGTGNVRGNSVFEQMLATVSGTVYAVSFDYGSIGVSANSTVGTSLAQHLRVKVLADGDVELTSSEERTTATGSYLPADTTFTRRTVTFTAASSMTLIQFNDVPIQFASDSCDGVLDAVSMSVVGGGNMVATPSFNPMATAYPGPQSVTISCTTTGATIRYTTDGSAPTASSGTVYTSAISITNTTTLKAIAYLGGMDPSAVRTGLFTIQAGPPAGTLGNGGFESGTTYWTVSSSDVNPARYAVGGDEGVRDGVNALKLGTMNNVVGNTVIDQVVETVAGTAYTLGFQYGAYGLSETQLLRVEILNGDSTLITSLDVSATGPGNYTATNTTFQPCTLNFTAASSVTMVRFKDMTPAEDGVGCDGVLDVVSLSGGSGVSTVATPRFSPLAGTFSSAQSVTLITTTDGASINYTINGIDPTTNSGTLYSGAIPVAATTTIKAIAYKPGMNPSVVTSATYTIQTGPVTNALVNGSFENGTIGWTVSSSDANPAQYAVGGDQGKSDGSNALKLGNDNSFAGNTVIEQTLATVVGAVYTVVFDYAAYGNANKQQALRMEAAAGATTLSALDVTASLTAVNFNPALVVFKTYTNYFEANLSSTTIRFKDMTTLASGDSCDGILDNVRVSGPPSGGTVTVKGTPVTWLVSHGLTGDPDARDMEDPDADGLKTWEEYVAGTDPTVKGNCFTTTLIWVSGRPVLSFNGLQATGTDYPSQDRYYDVHTTTNVGAGVWQAVPGYTGILGQGSLVAYTNVAPPRTETYRVRTRLQAR